MIFVPFEVFNFFFLYTYKYICIDLGKKTMRLSSQQACLEAGMSACMYVYQSVCVWHVRLVDMKALILHTLNIGNKRKLCSLLMFLLLLSSSLFCTKKS